MPAPPRPFIPADKVASLEMIYTLFGNRIENVLHVRNDDEWNASTLFQLCEESKNSFIANLAPYVGNSATLVKVRALDLSVDNSYDVERTYSEPGTNANGALPANVTIATKFGTGHSGRSYRGRAYWPAIPNNFPIGNAISTLNASNISAAWFNFFQDLIGVVEGHPQHVVVSFVEDGAWRSEALVNPIESYTTDVNLDSQRRRLNGRGE